MVASPQDAQTPRKTMSSAVVGTGKESVGKRAGSFGGRMKSFLRSSSSSKRDSNKKSRAQTILPKVTVHAEPPKLVHVESEEPPKTDINNGSSEVAGIVPSLSEEELLSDEVQSSSNCPSDAARYPQIIESHQKQDQEPQLVEEENVLDVSYASDNASLVRSLKAVAVVPVDTTPQKRRSVIIGSIDTDSTTDSASSSQSEPPHSPESVASPARSSVSQPESTTAKEDATVGEGTEGSSTYYQNLLLRSQDSDLEDESLSFGTFETLKSRDTALDGLSFVNAIGNLMERQLKVLEKNLPCQEEDKLNEIKEEAEAKEIKQIESVNGTKYVAADKEDDEDNDHDDIEHLKTSGRSMDSRIITGFTTPSTGTRIISNTPSGRQQKQKQQQNHQNSNEVDEMDDSLASSVSDDIDEDEDRIIPIEQKEGDLARAISEINIRMKNASQPPPSSSAGEPSILNILNDLAQEEDSEYRSIVSPSVSGTVSVLGDDIVSQQGGAWNVFECVHCQSEKLCAGQESSAKALEGNTSLLSYEGADLYDIAEENSLSPSTTSPGEIPVLLPIPESLPQHSVRAVEEEIPVEQAMEQTVESHELVVSTIKHSRADVSRLIRGASDKEAFLENFRAEFPDLYKNMVKELFLTAEKSSAKSKPKESNKSSSDKTFLALNRAMPAKTAKSKEDATSIKASKKVAAPVSGKSGQQAEPMSKRRSFFGVFGNKNAKKEVDNSSKTTKHVTKATGKEILQLKKPKRNAVEKNESSKVAKMVQQGTDRQPRLSTQKEANMKSQHEAQLSRATKSGKASVESQSSPGRGKELIKPVSPPRVVKKTEMPQFELRPESPESKPTTKHHTAVSAPASKPPKGKPATKENKTVSAPRAVQTILEKFHATPAPSLRKSHSASFQRPQPSTIKRSQSASAVKAASAATKRAKKASNKNASASVANKSPMEQKDGTRLTKASSLLQLSRTRKTEAPEAPKPDERPLRDSPSKASTSSTDAKSASRSRRKVAFSRTPLILQRLQSSRSAMASKSHEDSLEDGVSFLLEDEQGVSLKTSSWFDDEISVSGYMTPPSQTPDVLVTSHAIPQNPTPPSPVQLYGNGDKEFEEFDGYGEY